MVSFPTLVGLGLLAIRANATNTVGIWPGSVGSVVGFWAELKRVERRRFYLLVPATCGGVVGAILLRMTPAGVFDWIVPWLILFSVVLFIVQGPVRRILERKLAAQKVKRGIGGERPVVVEDQSPRPSGRGSGGAHPVACVRVAAFMVGFMGDIYGAGMSIMMLAVLGVLGDDGYSGDECADEFIVAGDQWGGGNFVCGGGAG